MPLPSALLVSRYRCFAGTEALPLRPLTLLYGRNNSGKSALIRALAILGASPSREAASASVIPPEIGSASFAELAWKGDAGDYTFDLGLRWDTGELREARYTLDGGPGRATYVKELVLQGEDAKVLWSGLAAPGRPMSPQEGQAGGELVLAGIVPQSTRVPVLLELSTRLAALRSNFNWLDGVRARPTRLIAPADGPPARLAPDGSNAASYLITQKDLLPDVSRFYGDLTPARELKIEDALPLGHWLQLNPRSRASWDIHILDTGEGMAQVLPVLVAAALAARKGSQGLLTMEEPESHLHLDAQNALARYLCAIAGRPEPPTIVVETHSRVFLLAVQLAVAKGLSPDRVGLAWIDQDDAGGSTITPVALSPSGHPSSGWPVSALAEDLRLASELTRLDLARGAA